MDDAMLEQLLSSQSGVEFTPTEEMMMMNSATITNADSIDPELLAAIQEQQMIISNVPVPSAKLTEEDSDDDLLLEDETILERIVALREMFPESVQNFVGKLNHTVINTSKLAYNKGRTMSWWVASTMTVLVFPILIQKELLQVAEQISREQRSILLGPQAATGAFSGGAF